jgi:hypothetical protein
LRLLYEFRRKKKQPQIIKRYAAAFF